MAFIHEVEENSSFAVQVEVVQTPLAEQLGLTVREMSWWVGAARTQEPRWTKQVISNPTFPAVILVPAGANICSKQLDEDRFVIVCLRYTNEHKEHFLYNYTLRASPAIPYPDVEDEPLDVVIDSSNVDSSGIGGDSSSTTAVS